jgi:uncharacterized membrane protein
MKTRLLSTWESIHTSFWFIPALMTIGAIGLSVLMLCLDELISFRAARMWEFIYPGSAQGARLLLSTIAGSVITVTGATTRTPEQRRVIRRHVEMVHRAGLPAAQEKKDRDDLEERFRAAVRELENLGG